MIANNDRLDRLERSVRQWRIVTVGLVLVMVIGVTLGQTNSPEVKDVVRCKSLEVVDEQDLPRIGIGYKGDNPVLALGKTDGKPAITMGVIDNKPAVAIWNNTGELVVTLGVDEYGSGRVGAWNRKGGGKTLQPDP